MTTDTLVYDIRNSRYINLTSRCSLVCQFCPKNNGSTDVHQYQLKLSEEPSGADIIARLGDPSAFDEIVFCGYGEPTSNLPALLEVARYVKANGGSVRVNTDGLGCLLHRRDILPELAECVDALSISLNAHNEQTYRQHCKPRLKGSYQAVREFIERAPRYIDKVYVSAIDGLEGVDIDACRQIVESAGAIFRHRRLDIVG